MDDYPLYYFANCSKDRNNLPNVQHFLGLVFSKKCSFPFKQFALRLNEVFPKFPQLMKEFVPLDFSQSQPVLTGNLKRISQFRIEMNCCESLHYFYIFTKCRALIFNMGMGHTVQAHSLLL